MTSIFGVKKAQISIFVIIAILIVSGVALVLVLKPFAGVPSQLQPIENYFLDCVSDLATEGAMILGEQGGYIELPSYEVGSDYMPSGSQMNFFGSIVPYWFYVSGNNIQKTQVPTLSAMEEQLADFIEDNIGLCTFDDFPDYFVETGDDANAKAKISDSDVSVIVDYPLTITYADTTKTLSRHTIKKKTKIGSLFKLAKGIFDEEQKRLFLENYAIDTIVLNAPTTGTEVSCTPKTWNTFEVENNIKEAFQDNIRTVKIKGDYYALADNEDKYFVQDLGKNIDEQIIFFYSPQFPTKLEIEPEENGLMKASPVGMQEGLGVLGFCYVPYHFVYSAAFPILVQIMDEGELFQFSTVAIVDKNMARESDVEVQFEFESVICQDERKIETVSVFTHDPYQNPVEAKISYKCMNSKCEIGYTDMESGNAMLSTKFPQCINGFISAQAEGFATAKQQVSTNEPALVDLTLYPYHELNVEFEGLELKEDERVYVSFSSDGYSTSLNYPLQTTVELVDGVYDIKALLFKKGDIKLEAETTETCVIMPAVGVLGLLGLEREECYDVEIPEQSLTEIIAGGGKTTITLDDFELSVSDGISISVNEFNVPKTVVEMQSAYALADSSEIYILLK